MPVHQFVDDPSLRRARACRTTGATTPSGSSRRTTATRPSRRRASRCRSSRRWSRRCTQADIEVILDVVYNHTAEGNHLGPTLSFRGIDNANYYRLVDDDQAHYFDTTGTGNSLLMRSPHVLQLIMDSLRYWVTEMHVDGFRFDLAATLARQFHEVDRLSAFFDLVHQDPIVIAGQAHRRAVGRRRRRLPGGRVPAAVVGVERQVPRHRARLLARRAVDARRVRQPPVGLVGPLRAHRPAARSRASTSSPRTTASRSPTSSRYNEKHNEANGEGNRDGESHNRSWNCGVEGPTDDAQILDAARPPAAQLPRHAAALAGRPDDRARRRDRPHPAGQQQRVLPGQRAVLDATGTWTRPRPRCSSSRASSSGCAATTRCSVAAASSRARPSTAASRTSGHRVARPRRASTWRTTSGSTARRAPSRCSSTVTRSPSRTCAARRSSTTRSSSCSTGSPTR